MVDAEKVPSPTNGAPLPRPKGPSKSQQIGKIYSLPAPLRTFPLPSFLPHNPLSLFHVLYAWVAQTIHPPSSHPEIPFQGWFSPETRSVHVTDPRSIQGLWEQGFYGKGSLSRSELSWLDREKRRKGAVAQKTSEEFTRQRRVERQHAKWERARKEREAIDQKLLEEQVDTLALGGAVLNGKLHIEEPKWVAPIGPLELLALPNSSHDLTRIKNSSSKEVTQTEKNAGDVANGHIQSSLPDGITTKFLSDKGSIVYGHETHHPSQGEPLHSMHSNGCIKGDGHVNGSASANLPPNGSADLSKQNKSSKSVRFSPNVEQTTFLQSEPPSPEIAATNLSKAEDSPIVIKDLEHLQLMMEEAMFLSYGLGVLTVLDPKTKTAILSKDLFTTFRHSSYFPPSVAPNLSPDDPFMLSYVVYHHFRSLGWVVRGGSKFSVDYLLYNRGPVFSHAEFAVLILPSYSDPSWSQDADMRDYVTKKEKRKWSWLHCINRVNSQVKKTLVLVYVDIPPFSALKEDGLSIDDILKRYKIREFVLKRWQSNRSRD